MHMCGKSLHFIDLKTYLLLHFNHSKIRMSLVIGKRIFKNARIANIHMELWDLLALGIIILTFRFDSVES